MKKILIMSLIGISVLVQAQEERPVEKQSRWMFGTTVGGSYENSRSQNGAQGTLYFSPNVGFNITNYLTVGASFDYARRFDGSFLRSIGGSAFARGYYKNFFLHGKFGYAHYTTKFFPTTAITCGGALGYRVRIGNIFSIEPAISYSRIMAKIYQPIYRENALYVQLGFQVNI